MEDPNFEFLIENHPKIYEYCKAMDYFIYDGEYNVAAINSRKAVESMVKYVDKHFNPTTFVDSHITVGKTFNDHIEDLYEQGHCSGDIKKLIRSIWRTGGEAAHNPLRTLKKERLDQIAEDTQKIIKYFFKELYPLSIISISYSKITGDEGWIKEMKSFSDDMNELNEEITKKEKENLKTKVEMADLETVIKNSESEIKSLKRKHQKDLAKFRREDYNDIGKIESIMDEKEKNHILQLNNLENKYGILKEIFYNNEKQLDIINEKLDTLIEKYNLMNIGGFKNKKSVLEIKYPPINLSNKNKRLKPCILDFSQLSAATSKSDKLVIDGGPGSGKTTVIIDRIIYLLNNYDPESFLVITFTEKAANELKERLKERLGNDYRKADKIHVSSIYSFYRTLLRDNSLLDINLLDLGSERIYIKNIFKEKFQGTSYIAPTEYNTIFYRFDETAMFRCDYERWIKFINNKYFKRINNLRDDEEFIDFLISEGLGNEDFVFPENIVRSNKIYNNRWYANKYLAIAEAAYYYNEIILKENSLYNYNRLQTAALDFLRENKDNLNIKYKNILIDEFQDIDIVQKEILEILLENADTFTIAGDKNQSIYSWRGSNYQYLEEFANKEGFEKVILNRNYRSGKNIVNFNENFLNRVAESKNLTSPKIGNDGAVYHLDNESLDEQSINIVKSIKYLHNEKGVKYSDMGLLFRSTLSRNVIHLIYKLKEEGINYNIRGNNDLESEKFLEIRGILNLLWYITDSMRYFNLEQFLYGTDSFYKFSELTINILLNQKINPKNLSKMNRIELENLGINFFDLEFLLELNTLKKEFYSQLDVQKIYNGSKEENTDNYNIFKYNYQLTTLDIFNKLLDICGYVDSQFADKDDDGYSEKNNHSLLNLALVSKIIKNYMKIVNEYDMDGLFKYLIEEYGHYSSPYNEIDKDDAVQILTVHKSKGLEFPVVFLCSIQLFRYIRPMKREDNPNSQFVTFPVPDKFLMNKTYDNYPEKQVRAEEKRLIYVANTRAKDLLILSNVSDYDGNVSPDFRKIKTISEKLDLNNLHTQLKDLKFTDYSQYNEFEKKPNLTFSSFIDYTQCKHKFDLKYNFGFEVDSSKRRELNRIVHDLLNKIHIKSKNDGEVDNRFIDEIFENIYAHNPFINVDGYESIIESIRKYWDDYGRKWEILEIEFPFTIKGDKYDFSDTIDLIVKENPNIDKISIINFKITDDLLNDQNINKKYLDQLQLSAYAISKDSHFKKYDISNLKFFKIDGERIYEEKNNFKIDEEQIGKLLNSLDTSVNEMYDGVFDKNLEHCMSCMYKDLCNVFIGNFKLNEVYNIYDS